MRVFSKVMMESEVNMIQGKPFEVPKDVYDRACERRGYMAEEDTVKYFNEATLCAYGLYNCKVHEEDGKYICTYETGMTCD